ncbi:MAG: hypothetical protein AAF441_08830 [Pseudomonadota bacterium]
MRLDAPDFQEAWVDELNSLFLGPLSETSGPAGFMGSELGAGTTSLAAACAQRVAKSGRNVLLIDFDISHWLGIDQIPDLSVATELSCYYRYHDSGPDRLHVPIFDPLPRWLDDPAAFRTMLDEQIEAYDLVLLDIPSPEEVLTGFSPLVAAKACELLYLVCLPQRLTRSGLSQLAATLGSAQVGVSGLILNDRYNPTLGAELARQARRIRRLLPRLSRKLEGRALGWDFINEQV